ncbi:MAG: DUF4342 domain-containing protein [Balneolales bacterium]
MSKTVFEEFKVTGNHLYSRVKELIREGNVRRVMVKDPNGRTLMETPLTFGVAGIGGFLVLAPFLTALAAAAVLLSDAEIIVERYKNDNDDDQEIKQDYIEVDSGDDDDD